MPSTPDADQTQTPPDRLPGRVRGVHAAGDGWTVTGSFLESILAGFLIGYLLDRWLDTGPWPIVVGIALGAYSGFVKLWRYSKRLEEGR